MSVTPDGCRTCGAPKGLHHYKTFQCPVGGVEATGDRTQEWADTTFATDPCVHCRLRPPPWIDTSNLTLLSMHALSDLIDTLRWVRDNHHEGDGEMDDRVNAALRKAGAQ